MKKQMSISELENLIKKNIADKGLQHFISEDKIQEIKNKIKKHVMSVPSYNFFATDFNVDRDSDGMVNAGDIGAEIMEEDNMNPGEEIKMPVQTNNSSSVTQQTISNTQANKESNELAKKEGEIETREQFLIRKEEELKAKEIELQAKEEALSYKPEMPSFIEKAEPAKIYVYNHNQLSYGSESLMKIPYGLVDNPENKKSMHDLWIEEGKIRAEVYQVEFKRIGDMVFKPLEGVCKFEQISSPIPENIPQEEREGVQQAIMSQQPVEPMVDSTEPIVDVVLPLSNDMGLHTPDVSQELQKYIEQIIINHFKTKKL